MARSQDLWESRSKVVECFLLRRSHASSDGSVYTEGGTLCVGQHHVAFWHQGTIYLAHIEFPDSLVKEVQAAVRLGDHGHLVAETGVRDDD
jgi:hypothetical protein